MITVGIDLGTQSTKVLVFDSEKSKILFKATSTYSLIEKKDGSREQKVEWFISALVDCFNQIPQSIKFQIQGIGVSGQQHGFVALDENGKALTNVKLWCDTSTDSQCKELTQKLGGEENVFSLIGNQIKSGYTVSKILYFKQNNPKSYSKLAHILLPHDYINWYLTGEYTCELGDASGTAMLDVRNKCWSKEVFEALDSEKDLMKFVPRIISFKQEAGKLTSSSAKALGLTTGIPVSCGGGDNMMGAIGCGCTSEGSLVMSMGTSGTLFGYSEKPVCDKKDRLAAFLSSSGGYLPLLCTMNCTVASEEVRKLFEMEVKDLDEIASSANPGCDGMIMLPYFNGERTPNYPKGKAVIAGIDSSNFNKANIARSALESAVYSMKVGLEAFEEQGFKPNRLILIGGGSNSSVWPQIVSNIMELEVVIPIIKESAAFGGAIQVLSLLEHRSIDETASKYVKINEQKHFKPEEKTIEDYRKAYETYKKYDNALSELFR
ncbi:MAG: xylulokinase [Sphaerochaetaceae bacterium]